MVRREVVQRLTRKGYLQCPLWCLEFGDDFANARSRWYESFEGAIAIVNASLRELYQTALMELGLPSYERRDE